MESPEMLTGWHSSSIMCARIRAPNETISSINKLLAYVPVEFIVLNDTTPGESKEEFVARLGNCCLCRVNIPASFYGNHRWIAYRDPDIPCDWVLAAKGGENGDA